MEIFEYGNKENNEFISIIGGIHGDEPKTIDIIYALKEYLDDKNINKRIKLIIANERAYEQDVRYIDTDMNRNFPGSINSESYEERIAHKIYNEVKNSKMNLSLHSSMSCPPPFIISTNFRKFKQTILDLPLKYCVDDSKFSETGTLDKETNNTITLEIGRQKSQKAYDFGMKACKIFIKSYGILEDNSINKTDVKVVETKSKLIKTYGDSYVYYNNFDVVPKGEIIARDGGVIHFADKENITPILISENGYNKIFGYIGQFKFTICDE